MHRVATARTVVMVITDDVRPEVGLVKAADVVAAALAIAFLVVASSHIAPTGDDRHLDVLGYALIVAAGGSLALCRRRPDVSVGSVTVILGTYLLRHYVGGPVFVTGWISLFFLSWRSTRRAAVTGAVVLCSVLIIAGIVGGADALLLHLVFVGWSASAVFLGEAMRNRRSYLTELEERTRYLEHTREEEAGRRVAEDRLRIARDLHDSVAHAMATINVQAGAAAHVVDRRPEAAKEALTVIQRASAEVLDELGAMLRLLRDDAEGLERAPTPGVEQVTELVASMSDANLSVSFQPSGALEAVPKPIGTAAYRIVQESLTNVLRHGGAAPTVVSMRVEDARFTVEVTDDGPGGTTESTRTGMGIRGMRERAEATGGTLQAGPRPDHGFTVQATWWLRS
jgi:signal transduction histidine kinase